MSVRAHAAQRGFTLLEMLLVVFILGMLAFTASAFVDNQDDQLRFEDTRNRLRAIRAAIVGKDADSVPGGYVADNGVLPAEIDDLTNGIPTGYTTSALQTPVLDSDPDTTSGLDDATNIASLTNQRLEKGWRATLYTPPGGAGFGDGWRAAGSAPNYTWQLASIPADLSIASQGKDGAVGGADYAADMTDTVAPAAWGTEIVGLTVRLSNQSGADIASRLRASLLVFVNTASGGKWKRFSSNDTPCLDGDGDGLVGVTPCSSGVTLTFPAGGYPGGAYASTRVPLGRHLLVLVRDTDAAAHNGATESAYPSAANPVALPLLCGQSGCPVETLVIR